MSGDVLLPYMCPCGKRFSEGDYNIHRETCAAEWVELPVDPLDPQVMTSGERRAYIAGYERAQKDSNSVLNWLEARNRLLENIYNTMPGGLRDLNMPIEHISGFSVEMLKALRAVAEAWPVFVE